MTHEQRRETHFELPKQDSRVDQDSVIKGIMDKLPDCSLGIIHEIFNEKSNE